MRFRFTALFVSTTIAAACAFPAHASTFSVQIRNNDSGGGPNQSGSTAVESGEVSFSSNQGRPNAYLGSATAAPGILRARGVANIEGIPANSNGINGESRASFILDDVFITGPVGVASVNATMNFEASGAIAVTTPADGSASAGFSMLITVPGSNIAGSYSVSNPGTVTATGLLASFPGPTISGSFASGTGAFSTTGPNVVSFSIIAGAGAGSAGGAAGQFARGISDFSNTVNLPSSGPVFNLPAGYTANPVSGLIVNNQWTGVVPEPSSIMLSVLCFIGFAAFRRASTTRGGRNHSRPPGSGSG